MELEDSVEVLDAAERLMQLSNDDAGSSNVVATENNHNNKNKKMKKVRDRGDSGSEEEVDQKRCQIEASIWLKIEEIFGKDEEGEEECGSICRPKKRRFRSVRSIYMNTKPIIVHGRFSGKGGGGRGVFTGLWS